MGENEIGLWGDKRQTMPAGDALSRDDVALRRLTIRYGPPAYSVRTSGVASAIKNGST
jgi:hypothetical protein